MYRTQPSYVTKRIVVDQVILMIPITQFQKNELESSHTSKDYQLHTTEISNQPIMSSQTRPKF